MSDITIRHLLKSEKLGSWCGSQERSERYGTVIRPDDAVCGACASRVIDYANEKLAAVNTFVERSLTALQMLENNLEHANRYFAEDE